jgi:glyoxylase-like metal-dependent hydrolase (beta-lactamase superfamily II)
LLVREARYTFGENAGGTMNDHVGSTGVSTWGADRGGEGPGARATPPARPEVHRLTVGEGGIFANGYLVEGASGVVAIDSALTVSGGRALRRTLDELGKPLLAVLLTHGHPDHYNGVAALIEGQPGVPVVATRAVSEAIRASDAAKEQQWRPMFGDEWPARRVFPSRLVEDGEALVLDDLRFTVHDLGPGESHADSCWTMESDGLDAFVGDLAFDGMHSYLTDGHSRAWLTSLARLEAELAGARTIYPGHGRPGGLALLATQRRYIEAYRAEVQARRTGGRLEPEAKREFVETMLRRYPEAQITFLVELGADPVAAELERDGW